MRNRTHLFSSESTVLRTFMLAVHSLGGFSIQQRIMSKVVFVLFADEGNGRLDQHAATAAVSSTKILAVLRDRALLTGHPLVPLGPLVLNPLHRIRNFAPLSHPNLRAKLKRVRSFTGRVEC